MRRALLDSEAIPTNRDPNWAARSTPAPAATFYVLTDLHLDAQTNGFPRFDDVAERAGAVVEEACNAKGSVALLLLGDVCNANSPRAHRCAAQVSRWAAWCAEAGVRWISIDGNHDVVEDGHGTSVLSPLAQAFSKMPGSVMHAARGTFARFAGVDLILLPYPSLANAYDPVRTVEEHASIWDGKSPVIAAGHLQVAGARMSSETYDMPRGRDVAFPAAALAAAGYGRRLFALNGHYHEQQEIRLGGMERSLYVPGSIERLTVDEHRLEPSWTKIVVAPGEDDPFAIDRTLVAPRKMVRLTAKDALEGGAFAEGALVRIDPPAGATAAQLDAARARAKGAAGVVFGPSPRIRQKASATGPAKSKREVAIELARERGGEELVELVGKLLDLAEKELA